MSPLFYKAWLECKMRFLLCLALGFFLLLNSVLVMPLKLTGASGAQLAEQQSLYWTIVLSLFLGLNVPIFALLLAGSGVNSQTNYGMLQGCHPSMYFTLSLPATRGQLLASRAGVGAALLLPLIAATHTALVWGARWRGAGGEAALQMESLPRVLLLGLVFYCLSIFLASVFDELWGSVIGLAFAGGVLGYNLAGGIRHGGLFRYVRGAADWSAAANLFLLGVCLVWLALSYRAVRRREY